MAAVELPRSYCGFCSIFLFSLPVQTEMRPLAIHRTPSDWSVIHGWHWSSAASWRACWGPCLFGSAFTDFPLRRQKAVLFEKQQVHLMFFCDSAYFKGVCVQW